MFSFLYKRIIININNNVIDIKGLIKYSIKDMMYLYAITIHLRPHSQILNKPSHLNIPSRLNQSIVVSML